MLCKYKWTLLCVYIMTWKGMELMYKNQPNQPNKPNQQNPILSVIVPVYSVEKYLEQCINSILQQTFTQFELIIIDDGSPDNSSIIADAFASKDQRISVYHLNNEGVSVARNYGLRKAKGQYIAFVDSDDWLEPNMFDMLIYNVKLYDADMVKCSYKNVFPDGKTEIKKFKIKQNKGQSPYILNALNGDGIKAVFNDLLVVWNAVYRRDICINVKFPEHVAGEDNYVVPVYYHKSTRIVYLQEPLYNYRRQIGGLSDQKISKVAFAYMTSMVKDYLDIAGYKNKYVTKRINSKFAKEIFSHIKDSHMMNFNVVSIDEELLKQVYRGLHIKRKIQLWFLCRGIKRTQSLRQKHVLSKKC